MEKWKRTIFFWVLVIAFFITAPAVILRARGYRFDFNRGVFVYSGSVTIKSNPQDITVSLNGKVNESKKLDRINSSYQVSGLAPGEYNIEISSPGFRNWSKKIRITSGLSTEFWNVVLTRENYEEEGYSLEKTEEFYISPQTDLLASTYQKEDSLQVDILNIENDEITHSFSLPNAKIVSKDDQENLEWSPENGRYISVPIVKTTSQEEKRDYEIIDLSSEGSFLLSDFLGISDIKNVRWNSQEENGLFFFSENKLYRADILDKNSLTLVSDDVSAFDISGSYIYFSQLSNHMIYRANLGQLSKIEQLTNTLPNDFNGQVSKLIVYDKERMILIDDKANLFIHNLGDRNLYFKKMSSNINGVHFSNDGKKLLFWTNNEISVYFLRDWDVQPTRQENETVNIARYLDSIENVQWFSDYEHVIFNTGAYMKIVELDPRDKRNCMDIITIENESQEFLFNFDPVLEKIFFIGKGNKLFSFEFPESTGILIF